MSLRIIESLAKSLLVTGFLFIFIGISQKMEHRNKKAVIEVNENYGKVTFNRWLIPLKTVYGMDVKSPIRKIRIAIVDTGVDWTHPMLSPFHAKNKQDMYQSGYGNPHGTHVAGIIAQHLTLAFGQDAYHLFSIESYRYEPGSMGSYHEALMMAVTSGADVLNLSVNGISFSNDEAIMLAYAYEQGMDIVAAAGNDGVTFPTFPCAYPFVTCVENSDGLSLHPSSNSGLFIQAQAPGVNVLSSLPGGEFGRMTGTSQSSPMVAAAKAVERINPNASKLFTWIKYKKDYAPIFAIEGLLRRTPASK